MSTEAKPLPLFVYGTLMKLATLEVASGRTALTAEPAEPFVFKDAELHGFQVFKGEQDRGWPYVVARDGGVAPGKLVYGLSELELKRLKAYESAYDPETDEVRPLFSPERATVIADGKPVECIVYMPVFENWHFAYWRNSAEKAETARLEMDKRNAATPVSAKALDRT